MTNKMKLLIVLIFIFSTGNVFGDSIRKLFGEDARRLFGIDIRNEYRKPIIDEAEIPMPEIQYELPKALIGDFIMITPMYNLHITIFPNNKYIVLYDVPYHAPSVSYGYIVNKDNKWYFTRLSEQLHNYFYDMTEIRLSDTGFSFFDIDSGEYCNSIREENLPLPECLAEDITIPATMVKRQYFSFNDSGGKTIEFNELEPDIYGSWTHRLQIDKGILRITRVYNDGAGLVEFDGFMEKTDENANGLKGIIRFTNGIPYYYINNGTADININNDGSIVITMLYTPEMIPITEDLKKHEKFADYYQLTEGLQFPAKLILEF